MPRPKTAFELHEERTGTKLPEDTKVPVVFSAPNSSQPGMEDFRPALVPSDAPDPDEYERFKTPTDPKDWRARASAPILTVPAQSVPESPAAPTVLKDPEKKDPAKPEQPKK